MVKVTWSYLSLRVSKYTQKIKLYVNFIDIILHINSRFRETDGHIIEFKTNNALGETKHAVDSTRKA